ncbi:MAG: hypothetical protein AABZ32_00345 [Bacteroidota bacterium]
MKKKLSSAIYQQEKENGKISFRLLGYMFFIPLGFIQQRGET